MNIQNDWGQRNTNPSTQMVRAEMKSLRDYSVGCGLHQVRGKGKSNTRLQLSFSLNLQFWNSVFLMVQRSSQSPQTDGRWCCCCLETLATATTTAGRALPWVTVMKKSVAPVVPQATAAIHKAEVDPRDEVIAIPQTRAVAEKEAVSVGLDIWWISREWSTWERLALL